MNYYIDRSQYALRKVYRRITKKKHVVLQQNPQAIVGQAGCDVIFDLLSKDEPCFIARFGSIELEAVCTYLNISSNKDFFLKKAFDFVTYKKRFPFWWAYKVKYSLCNNAGFFPLEFVVQNKAGEVLLEKYAKLILDCVPHIDAVSSICFDEKYVIPKEHGARIIGFNSLEPYLFENPWSRVLKGKKVLVIHPLANTIEMQYEKREKLFKNPDVLPEFELKTIKAVQSIAGNKPDEYENWFEALDGMKKQISEKDFDIALIGCGAYAIPLAKYCKDLGKKAITICGALQILFGIKGRRWETEYNYGQRFYNEYWVNPSPDDKPKNLQKVENGCYW